MVGFGVQKFVLSIDYVLRIEIDYVQVLFRKLHSVPSCLKGIKFLFFSDSPFFITYYDLPLWTARGVRERDNEPNANKDSEQEKLQL